MVEIAASTAAADVADARVSVAVTVAIDDEMEADISALNERQVVHCNRHQDVCTTSEGTTKR